MSAVVHLSWHGPHVAVIRMEDRAHSNLLTEPFMHDMARCIGEARANPNARVMVVHGYDSIFCTGGTQDQLLAIADGKLTFDEPPFYRMFLDSEIPVIASSRAVRACFHVVGLCTPEVSAPRAPPTSVRLPTRCLFRAVLQRSRRCRAAATGAHCRP